MKRTFVRLALKAEAAYPYQLDLGLASSGMSPIAITPHYDVVSASGDLRKDGYAITHRPTGKPIYHHDKALQQTYRELYPYVERAGDWVNCNVHNRYLQDLFACFEAHHEDAALNVMLWDVFNRYKQELIAGKFEPFSVDLKAAPYGDEAPRRITDERRLYQEIPCEGDLMNPTLEALWSRDGRATTAQIRRHVVKALNISEQAAQFRMGKSSELGLRLRRARADLKRYGVIENLKSGVWTITKLGRSVSSVDPQDVTDYAYLQDRWERGEDFVSPRMLTTRYAGFRDMDSLLDALDAGLSYETWVRDRKRNSDTWKSILHELLLTMSPRAFEHLIVRLLLEYSNIDKIEITDRVPDEAIYGSATIRHSEGSFQIPLTVKRYGVYLGDVQEFRGRMRETDSGTGIILATRKFARDARTEASREPSIVALDGSMLLERLRQLGWGVIDGEESVDVDTYYFRNYHLFYSVY